MSIPQKITVTSAYFENRMCPTIIRGISAAGWTVYVRYRWGRLSIRIDPREPPPLGGANGKLIYESKIDPNGLEGWMSYEELKQHTAEIVEWPEELTPKTYGDIDTWPDEF